MHVEPGTAVQVAAPSWGKREAGRGAPGQQSLGGGPQEGPCTQAPGWTPGNCFNYFTYTSTEQTCLDGALVPIDQDMQTEGVERE